MPPNQLHAMTRPTALPHAFFLWINPYLPKTSEPCSDSGPALSQLVSSVGTKVRQGWSQGHEEHPTSDCRKAQLQFPGEQREGQGQGGSELLTPLWGTAPAPAQEWGTGKCQGQHSQWLSPVTAPHSAACCDPWGSQARAVCCPHSAGSLPWATWGPAHTAGTRHHVPTPP